MVQVDPFRLLGTIVDGRYRVEQVAGRGGYGVVYRAFHLSFESTIALKVLKLPEDIPSDRRMVQVGAFQQEGKLLFELSLVHPSIVKAFEAGTVALFDGSVAPYLALEWLDGISLEGELKHRRKHQLPPLMLPEVLSLLDDAAQGLALAHARGIVHRDIKPGNLFVARRREGTIVKILDFGVAKLLDESSSTTTRLATTGPSSSFTPMYGSPEQWLRRLGATGTWTDVHAWALVCVELLSGQVPLAGDEAAQFMAACLDPQVRPTPRTLGLDVSDTVEAAFARGLALDPRERHRDLGEFWAALCDAARWSRKDARAVSLSAFESTNPETGSSPAAYDARRDVPSSTTMATASRSIERPPPRTSSHLWTSLVAGGALGALALLLFILMRDSSGGSAREQALTEPSETSGHASMVPTSPFVPIEAPSVGSATQAPEPVPSSSSPSPALRSRTERLSTKALPPSASASLDQLPTSRSASMRSPVGDRPLEIAAIAPQPPAPVSTTSPVRGDAGSSLQQLLGNEELQHRR